MPAMAARSASSSSVPSISGHITPPCEKIHQLKQRTLAAAGKGPARTGVTGRLISLVFSTRFRHDRRLTLFHGGPYTGRSHPRMRILLLPALIAAAIAGVMLTSGIHAPLRKLASRERTLFVSAVDAKGEPVEGLGPDAFVVREDGRRREVLRVSRATEPIDLALLVDNSQAVTDEITPSARHCRSSSPRWARSTASP